MNVFYFVITKDAKIYHDEIYGGHNGAVKASGLKEDEVVKMMYYKKDCHYHELFDEYAIQGLRLSVTYETSQQPFELNNSHLDAIEKFIITI